MGVQAFLLPIRGQCGFLLRPSLWRHVVAPFLVTSTFTLVALWVLFAFAYWPQVLKLVSFGVEQAMAEMLVMILTFIECSFLSLFLFMLLFGAVTGQIMISVLEERGVDEKLWTKFGVELKDNTVLGDACDKVAFQMFRLPLMVLTGPLMAIPVIGPVLWQLVNGCMYTWELVTNLLPFIGFESFGKQFVGHIFQNVGTYSSFGFVALLLEMVPFLNILFVFGNAVGAALLFETFVDEAPPHRLLKVGP